MPASPITLRNITFISVINIFIWPKSIGWKFLTNNVSDAGTSSSSALLPGVFKFSCQTSVTADFCVTKYLMFYY